MARLRWALSEGLTGELKDNAVLAFLASGKGEAKVEAEAKAHAARLLAEKEEALEREAFERQLEAAQQRHAELAATLERERQRSAERLAAMEEQVMSLLSLPSGFGVPSGCLLSVF